MGRHRRSLGEKGERVAKESLIHQGYRVLVENYSCPLGEIDLVALDGETLVFVEVRTKTGGDFGPPQASVRIHKQRQIAKVAEFYMAEKGIREIDCRFDVVAVNLSPEGRLLNVEIIKDAFPREGHFTF